jgi:hypothetical protein
MGEFCQPRLPDAVPGRTTLIDPKMHHEKSTPLAPSGGRRASSVLAVYTRDRRGIAFGAQGKGGAMVPPAHEPSQAGPPGAAHALPPLPAASIVSPPVGAAGAQVVVACGGLPTFWKPFCCTPNAISRPLHAECGHTTPASARDPSDPQRRGGMKTDGRARRGTRGGDESKR